MVLNTEQIAQKRFSKKVVLQISENSLEMPAIESLKEGTQAQVFSCEFWEICKNTFFIETSGGCFCQYASEILK